MTKDIHQSWLGAVSRSLELGHSQSGKGQADHLIVKPHNTSIAVWDARSPIPIASRFKVKVGVSCDAGCSLAGYLVEVVGEEGEKVEGHLGDLPLPKTSSLYWTELECKAPGAVGYHEWTASFHGGRTSSPHEGTSYKFGLMTVEPPRHLFEVSIKDSTTKEPLANAYVRVGEHTLFSDETGTAKVPVAEASYEVVLWKRDHKMLRTRVEVTGDQRMDAELVPSPCKYCPDST